MEKFHKAAYFSTILIFWHCFSCFFLFWFWSKIWPCFHEIRNTDLMQYSTHVMINTICRIHLYIVVIGIHWSTAFGKWLPGNDPFFTRRHAAHALQSSTVRSDIGFQTCFFNQNKQATNVIDGTLQSSFKKLLKIKS